MDFDTQSKTRSIIEFHSMRDIRYTFNNYDGTYNSHNFHMFIAGAIIRNKYDVVLYLIQKAKEHKVEIDYGYILFDDFFHIEEHDS